MPIITLILSLTFSGLVMALTPLESLILGDFSKELSNVENNPLNNIYQLNERDSRVQFKRQLSRYRGLVEEGENLKNYCSIKFSTSYPHPWDRDTVKRSYLSTLQYIGIDIASMALPEYAKFFNFNKENYINLVDYLVDGYCSDNLSIISKTQLKRVMTSEFDKNLSYSLPTLSNNPLFPQKFREKFKEEEIMKKEFGLTLNIFKSMCSWGANTVDLRLLTPFAKNSILMSFIISQLSNYEIKWNSVDNHISRHEKNDTVKVLCKNLICRKTSKVEFRKKIPRMLGTQSVEEDLKRLYSEDFMFSDFKIVNQPPKIKSMMTKFSEYDFKILSNHLVSLISGIPNFLSWVNKPNDLVESLRYGIDHLWQEWAENEVENKQRQFYFEEPLTVELISKNVFFDEYNPDFKVLFDINLGEFDRANQKVGKIKASFFVNLDMSFVQYIRKLFKRNNQYEKKIRKEAYQSFKIRLKDQILLNRNKFEIPPWKGPLEKLVAKSLIDQFVSFRGDFFDKNTKGKLRVPIYLFYGPFALKYITYKYKMNKSKKRLEDNDLLTKAKN